LKGDGTGTGDGTERDVMVYCMKSKVLALREIGTGARKDGWKAFKNQNKNKNRVHRGH
jgi:hypothetical protein